MTPEEREAYWAYLDESADKVPSLSAEQVDALATVFSTVNDKDPRCDEQRGPHCHRGEVSPQW